LINKLKIPMMKFFTFSVFVLIFLGLVLFNNYPGASSAYNDDPQYDRVPEYLMDGISYFSSPLSVITIDDFDNFDIGVDFAECHISENPQNPLWYFTAYNINGTHRTINGHDWSVINPSFPNASGDPVTAYDSLGTLYYDNMKSPITGTWMVRSTNNGQNWTSAVTANIGVDKNWIAADQTAGPYSNYVYGVMTGSGSICNFVRSTNQGASFSSPITMTPHSLPGAMVCVGPQGSTQGGAVYVVTNSGSAFASVYTFFRSTNGGANFTSMSSQNFANYVGTNVSGRNSVQNMRTRPYPFIAADNSYGANRGRLYLVYASNEPAGNLNKPDIFCRYSDNGGTSWSAAIKVNDDVNTQNHNQWHPAIWCDKETGRLYVQWMDTRDTPTSDSALIYATYSNDGGQTFVTNQMISNKKMRINCTTCGGGGTPRYQGDYNAIVSNSQTSMVNWTDFRNGNFGSYTAYFPDFGMRVNPTSKAMYGIADTAYVSVGIPAVKLYTNNVTFSATVTPTPPVGTIVVNFPNGNTLSSYPDSLVMRVITVGLTSIGNYNIVVTGEGPNGTPVHKRTFVANVGITGVSGDITTADNYSLEQNFPNPFNPVTRIEYSLQKKTDVKLVVYDLVGKEVASFNQGEQAPGSHFVIFNGTNLSSGVYYYKIITKEFTDTKKMLLIK
jgi:hypothetical protein